MALPAAVIDAWESMDDMGKAEVLDFMQYVARKRIKDDSSQTRAKGFPFGCLEGGLIYISDDFDEPLEEFKEYM